MSEEKLVEALKVLDKLGFCVAKSNWVKGVPTAKRGAPVHIVKHEQVIKKLRDNSLCTK
jgi:beta-xylosidase